MADTKQIPSLRFEKYIYTPIKTSYELPNTMYPMALKSVSEMMTEIESQRIITDTQDYII